MSFFQGSLAEAMERAQSEARPLMVVVKGEEEEEELEGMWEDKEVVAGMQETINLELLVGSEDCNVFKRSHDVSILPIVYFVAPNMDSMGFVTAPVSVDKVRAGLAAAAERRHQWIMSAQLMQMLAQQQQAQAQAQSQTQSAELQHGMGNAGKRSVETDSTNPGVTAGSGKPPRVPRQGGEQGKRTPGTSQAQTKGAEGKGRTAGANRAAGAGGKQVASNNTQRSSRQFARQSAKEEDKERKQRKQEMDKQWQQSNKERHGASERTGRTSRGVPPPPPAAKSTAQAHVHASTEIGFQLTNGQTLYHTFVPETTVKQVESWLATNRTDGPVSYVLAYGFPPRDLGAGDSEMTLEQLDLVPGGRMVLKAMEATTYVGPTMAMAEEHGEAGERAYGSTGERESNVASYMGGGGAVGGGSSSSSSSSGVSSWLGWLNPFNKGGDKGSNSSNSSKSVTYTPSKRKQPKFGARVQTFGGLGSSKGKEDAEEGHGGKRNDEEDPTKPIPGEGWWQYGPNLKLERLMRERGREGTLNQPQGQAQGQGQGKGRSGAGGRGVRQNGNVASLGGSGGGVSRKGAGARGNVHGFSSFGGQGERRGGGGNSYDNGNSTAFGGNDKR